MRRKIPRTRTHWDWSDRFKGKAFNLWCQSCMVRRQMGRWYTDKHICAGRLLIDFHIFHPRGICRRLRLQRDL